MSLEENKKVVKEFFDALENGDAAKIDSLTTEGFVFHAGRGVDVKKEMFIKMISGSHTVFDDHGSVFDEMIAEGDSVAARLTVRGTHVGQFGKFAPTGKSFSMPEYFFFRLENGKIAEDWGLKDTLDHYQQLGILPPDDQIGD